MGISACEKAGGGQRDSGGDSGPTRPQPARQGAPRAYAKVLGLILSVPNSVHPFCSEGLLASGNPQDCPCGPE